MLSIYGDEHSVVRATPVPRAMSEAGPKALHTDSKAQ